MRDLCSASQLRFRVAGDCKTQRGGERLRDACVHKRFTITLGRRQLTTTN